MAKRVLRARDIERLENTSFASAAGVGPIHVDPWFEPTYVCTITCTATEPTNMCTFTCAIIQETNACSFACTVTVTCLGDTNVCAVTEGVPPGVIDLPNTIAPAFALEEE